MDTTIKLCTKKLHDLTLPNAIISCKIGTKLCRQCDRDKQRRWYHARFRFCKDRQARRLAGQPVISYEEFQHANETTGQ